MEKDKKVWYTVLTKDEYRKATISSSDGKQPQEATLKGKHVLLYHYAPFTVSIDGNEIGVGVLDSMKEMLRLVAPRKRRTIIRAEVNLTKYSPIIIIDEEPPVEPILVEQYYKDELKDYKIPVIAPKTVQGVGVVYEKIGNETIKKSRRLGKIRAIYRRGHDKNNIFVAESLNEMFWVVLPWANKVIRAEVVEI